MTSPTLRDIEKALYELWNKREKRELFLRGDWPDGVHPALAGHIDERGVRLYSSLMEIGRQDLMASIYPVCKELLGKSFAALVNDYFEKMPPTHFNLNQSARRFPEYLKENAEKQLKRYPFLCELAEYEWLELAVMEDEAEIQSNLIGLSDAPDPLQFAATFPVLNPTLVTRAFKYPIADIIEAVEAGEKMPRRQRTQASYTLFFRCPEREHCRFLQVGELPYELVQRMRKNLVGSSEKSRHCNYGELITFAVGQVGGDAQECVEDVLELIAEFKTKGLIIAEFKASQA